MPAPIKASFDPSISLGHIMTMVTMLIGLGVGWGVHSTTLTHLETEDRAIRRDLDKTLLAIERHATAIHALDISSTKIATSLEQIKDGVKQIQQKQ